MNEELLAQEWQALIRQYSDVLPVLQALTETHRVELARAFYDLMLENPGSSPYLSHDQVRTQLSSSLQRWIVAVFAAQQTEQVVECIDMQQHVGKVHARIEVPVSLVLRGARQLKSHLSRLLLESELDAQVQHAATRLACQLIDLTMEIMSQAYSLSHDRNSRAEEAYRLFSVSQNLGAEKERQRGALLDWENQLMFALATGQQASYLPRLADSEFGLWFRHKASHAFQGSPESTSILTYIRGIDSQLDALRGPGDNGPQELPITLLRQTREQTKSIRFLLDSLFEQANDLEAGRDALTHLLNRKFLPVVMSKEVLYSRQSGHGFAVLLIDVDHFKQINDTHGHEAGDLALQQIASLLTSNTRGGDYAFRHGGEEFLLVLVDIEAGRALQVAEGLRQRIASEPFRIGGQTLQITVSIGVAVHDGHPDYQRLLRRADQALYQAKRDGRNRSILLAS
jgi:diguanylate cyclase